MPSRNTLSPTPPTVEADAAAGGMVGPVASTTSVAPAQVEKSPTTLSRRKQRQVLNAKHAAPQFPRIQNPQQRAKAYIRAAGLQQQQQGTLNSLDAAELQLGRKLGGPDERTRHQTVLQLKAYLKARTEPTAAGLSEWDLLKLCKCLWYCLYMADRVPVQQELSHQMASLVWCCAGTEEQDECAAATYLEMCGDDNDFDDEEEEDEDDEVIMEEIENTLYENMEEKESDRESNEKDSRESETESSASEDSADYEAKQAALLLEQGNQDDDDEDEEDYQNVGHCRGAHLAALFVRCWFRTIVREWTHMDKYRIDKFYTLLRDLLQVMYQYMARRHWNLGLIRLFNDALHEEILTQTPNGVRYHMVDICVEELAKVANLKDSPTVTEAIFLDVMEPFFALAQTGGRVSSAVHGDERGGADDTVHRRVIEHVLEKFLYEYSVFRNNINDKNSGDKPVLDQVHVGTVANFIFEVGGSEGVKNASYRKTLYETYKKYVKRIKEVGDDKDVDIEGNESDYEDDDEEGCRHDHDHEIDHNTGKDRKRGKGGVSVNGGETRGSNITPPTNKSKRRDDEEAAGKAVPEQVEQACGDKKRKRKKKKILQESEIANDGHAGNSSVQEPIDNAPSEEEITISIAHQKAASKMLRTHCSDEKGDIGNDMQATDTKKRRCQGNSESQASERKRVKFGSKNGARSWKASMKGLRTMESPVTDARPEESILRNKVGASKKLKKISLRKKAGDYF